jgi:hypothetical protein
MDLTKLSDEGLMKLYAALQQQQQPAPEQTAGQMAAETPTTLSFGPLDTGIKVPPAIGAGLIGAGKSFDDLIQGGKQLYYRATSDDAAAQDMQAQHAQAAKHYGALQDKYPIVTSVGASVPTMAAMLATGGSASLPMALGKAALSSGLTEAAKYGTDQERFNRGIVGAAEGAAGTGIGYGLGRLITPRGLTGQAPSQEALDAVKRLGIELTPGQRTGDIPLRKLEQMLAQRTGSAGQFSDLAAANQAALNRGAASAMGETADAITPDIFAAARTRIGGDFQRLTKGTDVKLGNDFLNALVDVEAQHATLLPSLQSPKVLNIIDDALAVAAKGKISGEAYQSTRSSLTKAAKDAFNQGNSAYGQALKGVATALDDAAGQSLTLTEKAAWDQARKQWKALRILETGNVVQDANVSAQLLKGQVKKADPVLYREGKTSGPLTDIARYAEGVKTLADSGTPAGMQAMQMGSPMGMFQTLMGTPFRWTMAKGMLSKPGTDWLANGVLTDEARKRLMQAGGLLGVAAGPGP